MGIINDFLKYYKTSVICYQWYNSLSDLTVLSKKDSTGEILHKLPTSSTLERKTREFNLKDKLQEIAIEHNDHDRVFPLDSGLKNQFEMVYAVDFGQVLIHLGATADQITRDHSALAVTQGNDIYFHSDQYVPNSQEGQKLLAHELQHVQQFQSGQNMNENEDIKDLEDNASEVEAVLSELNLHSLTKPILSQDSQTGTEEMAANLADSQDSAASYSDITGPDESLDSFSGKVPQINYRVHFENGKYYDYTPKEYEALLDELSDKMEEYFAEKKYSLNEEKYIALVQKVTDMIERGKV
jgi:hypothetical protein